MPPLERETGFEPATSTLARLHSTAELFPPFLSKLFVKITRFVNNCQARTESRRRGDEGIGRLKEKIKLNDDLLQKLFEISHSGDDGNHQCNPEKAYSNLVKIDRKVLFIEYKKSDGSNLEDSLIFP
jgi:hypothetical protein